MRFSAAMKLAIKEGKWGVSKWGEGVLDYIAPTSVSDEFNSDYSVTYKHDASYSEVKNAAFVRFCFTGITDGAVITKNEEIV